MVPEDRVRACGKKQKFKLFKSCTIPSGHNFNFSLSAESGAGGDPDPNIHEQCPKGATNEELDFDLTAGVHFKGAFCSVAPGQKNGFLY